MTDPATRAAKVFLGVAAVAGTLGGWAVLASNEPEPAAADRAVATPAVRRDVPRAAPRRAQRTVPVTFTRSSR